MKTKICSKCGQELSLGEFHKGNGKYGRAAWCKRCFAIYAISPKGKTAHAKYYASPKGKAANAKYRTSPKGKAAFMKARAKYRASLKGKATQAKYRASPKGKAAHAKYYNAKLLAALAALAAGDDPPGI